MPSDFPAPKSWVSTLFVEVSYVSCNGSLRILKKAWEFFSRWYHFHNFLKIISFQKNISSSFFQYSDRTVASTEANDTSTERSDFQLFEARKTEGIAFLRRLHTHLPQKEIEKKSKFNKAKSGCIFFILANLILIFWAKCKPIAFELQQGLSCIFINCQTY